MWFHVQKAFFFSPPFILSHTLLPPFAAAPGIISASPYAGAHGFPPTFAIQQAAGLSPLTNA